jgi:galactofuranose transport system permease protein
VSQPRKLHARHITLMATAAIFVILFTTASLLYPGFCSKNVVLNLFSESVVLGIIAVGMTLVIFSGGIDLSVGAVIGCTAILTATLMQKYAWSPWAAWPVALAAGTGLGWFMGWLISSFKLPPFLITLAGMFLARGIGFWINTESVAITNPTYAKFSEFAISLGGVNIQARVLVLIVVLVAGYVLAHQTRFGRTLLAVGGNEQSASLMGLPVSLTKTAVYAVSGFCAALAGIVMTLNTGSAAPNWGVGDELDAIAVVVIGGTLLTGGRGHMLGTLFGLLIFGTIQSALLFDGRLGPAWNRIVVGTLLLTFILLQRFLVQRATRRG